jgi:M6 family metalloprotease-like protein
MTRLPRWPVAVALLTFAVLAPAAEPFGHPKDPRVIDATLPALSEFRTVTTAVVSRVSRAAPAASSQPGYLGVHAELVSGQVVVADVEPESPAARAGLQPGDVIRAVAGQDVRDPAALRDLTLARAPGESVPLLLLRRDEPLEIPVTLAATSRPLSLLTQRAVLGLQVSEVKDGLRVERITPGMPAADAGLKTGDVLVSIDGLHLSSQERLTVILAERKPGDTVTVAYQRDGKPAEVKAKLVADPNTQAGDPRQLQWDTRGLVPWKKDVFHLAVLRIEYPDVKHNAQITAWDWEQALFSRGVYNDKSATGQPVYGSMNDYYLEQSCGAFHVEGKAFDPIQVSRKRADYANDGNRFALLTEAMDKILARDGADALKEFDGVFFMYAGDRFQTNRGGLYWPHRAMVFHKGKRWNYFICPEGASRMDTISVTTHEFGHMLGLPDLYARPESPGSEGLGIWCTMAVGHGQIGRPLHFSAWCKEQLGWLKPTVIDPTVKQKLVLAPVENSPRECFKVLLRPDGTEYLLLENRAARSFDRDLPASGLLIWRVVDGKPVLEESHGIEGPAGPDRFLMSVPYPSKSNNAFTPYTTPSSRSQKGGGLPVWITNIRRLPDGRVTFYIGYEYL